MTSKLLKRLSLLTLFSLALGFAPSLPLPFSQPTVVYANNTDDDDGSTDDDSSSSKAESSGEDVDGSFYEKAGELASTIGSALSAVGGEGEGVKRQDARAALSMLTGANAGNAGGAFGFAEKSVDPWDFGAQIENLIGALANKQTMVYSYRTLANIRTMSDDDSDEVSSDAKGAYHYALYGKAFTDLGMLENAGFFEWVLSFFGGLILFVFYVLASIAPIMFSFTVWLLSLLNPFAILARFGGETFELLNGVLDIRPSSTFASIGRRLADYYDVIREIGLIIVIPFMLASAAASIFLFNKMAKVKSKILKIFVRLLIMIWGVPLVGVFYTSSLEGLLDTSSNTSSIGISDYVIASTLGDLENYGRGTRFAPLSANKGDVVATNGTQSLVRYKNLRTLEVETDIRYRDLILKMNYAGRAGSGYDRAFSDLYNGYFMGSAGTGREALSVPANDPSGNQAVKDHEVSGNRFSATREFLSFFTQTSSGASASLNLISRWMNGDTFTSADYESMVKSSVAGSSSASNGLVNLLTLKGSDLKTDGGGGNNLFSPVQRVKSDSDLAKGIAKYGYNIYNNGSLEFQEGTGGFRAVPVGSQVGHDARGTWKSIHVKGDFSNRYGFGLSDIAMYNFLTTRFNSNSMDVVSTRRAMNTTVAVNYKSVILAGKGLDGLLIWLESIVMLGTSAWIGFFFAKEMFRRAWKTMFSTYLGIAGSFGGSLTLFAKMTTATVMVVVQILCGFAFYGFINDMMVAFMGIVGG